MWYGMVKVILRQTGVLLASGKVLNRLGNVGYRCVVRASDSSITVYVQAGVGALGVSHCIVFSPI